MFPFSHKLESDNREPAFTFEMAGGTYGVLVPSTIFWLQMVSIVVIQGAFLAIVSLATYELIAKRRHTSTAYLFGWGLIVPTCAILPIYALEYFDLRNRIIRFLFSAILPSITLFKCISTMFGFNPNNVEKSPGRFAFYSANSQEIVFDPITNEAVKVTASETISHATKFVRNIVILGLYSSWVSAYDYHPFTKKRVPGETSLLSNLIDPRQIANNLSVAIIFQLYLMLFGEGLVALTNIVTGIKVKELMRNPLFESESPSDFWGRRWNAVVHSNLKRGVYKPVRSYFSEYIAALSTFVVSGLFHEWILLAVFDANDHPHGYCEDERECYKPVFGNALIFFAWNAVLISLEYAIGRTSAVQSVKRALPRPIRSLLIILLAIPIAHIFMDPYTESDYFRDAQIGLPMIVKVS